MASKREGDDYGSLFERDTSLDKAKRASARIRASPTFRLGLVFTRSVQRPWRLLWLPLSVFWLLLTVVRERLGHIPRFSDYEEFERNNINRESIVVFPTNGVGFGHFTRALAISRRMKKINPNLEIVFFTTMPTLHILQEEGFPAYHLPGRKKFQDMGPSTWNEITEEMLSNVFDIHRPKAFIFDGTYPYRGMLNAIKRRDGILRIWIRRQNFKKSRASLPVDGYSHFDLLINPSDSTKNEENEVIESPPSINCDPITLLEGGDLLPRESLRWRLGVPLDATLAYVQLGAGKVNDIVSDLWIVLQSLNDKGIYAVVGESMLGSRINTDDFKNIRILRDYPNSQFFNSFDFSIIAGGYNSYHESINFSMPSICIPNVSTGMDDQLRRARVAEEKGAMIVIRDVTIENMHLALDNILDESFREKMRSSCASLRRPSGANQVASHIVKLLEEIT